MVRDKYQKWLEPEGLALLEGWARDGLTDKQIAHNMGIGTRTLYNWKKAYLPIMQALKAGKEVVDYQVENSLLKRALGYEYDEEKFVDGEVVTIKRQVQPDTTAIIFWLKNRRPDKWRDKPEPISFFHHEQAAAIDAARQAFRDMIHDITSDGADKE